MEGETTHRLPAHDEIHTSKHILAFTRTIANEYVTPETFEYVPPEDALDASDPLHRGGFASGSGGGGHRVYDPDKGKSCESWHSHDWAGETLIEQSKLRLHGFDFNFERRLTFSDDRHELRISERISGPRGHTDRDLSIPLT